VASEAQDPQPVAMSVILREWMRIGCTGFGGPPAHITLLQLVRTGRPTLGGTGLRDVTPPIGRTDRRSHRRPARLAWVAFKVGALSYGGGSVHRPLIQHDAVHTYHWMTAAQFLDAVALGQITPGPVVQTVAVVG
jgi:chromate transport protein ChrA